VFGLVVPAGVPAPIVARQEAEAQAAIADPAVATRIVETGGIPKTQGWAACARLVAEETVRLQAIVRASRAVAD